MVYWILTNLPARGSSPSKAFVAVRVPAAAIEQFEKRRKFDFGEEFPDRQEAAKALAIEVGTFGLQKRMLNVDGEEGDRKQCQLVSEEKFNEATQNAESIHVDPFSGVTVWLRN